MHAYAGLSIFTTDMTDRLTLALGATWRAMGCTDKGLTNSTDTTDKGGFCCLEAEIGMKSREIREPHSSVKSQ
jgi:hypothetical protein